MVDKRDSPPLLRAEVIEEDFMKEPIKLRPSVVSATGEDFMKEPIKLRPSVPVATGEHFVKETVKLRPSIPKVTVPRRIIHQAPEYYDVGPPTLEQEMPEMYPADSDWIEGEIEVPSSDVPLLPDGQMDIELD
ncbi:hypothetical protein COOONC_04137 [Cooperia oncophora]